MSFSLFLVNSLAQSTTPSEDVARIFRLIAGHGGEVLFGSLPEDFRVKLPLPDQSEVTLYIGSPIGFKDIYIELLNPARNDEAIKAFLRYYANNGWNLLVQEKDDANLVYYQPTTVGWKLYEINPLSEMTYLKEVTDATINTGWLCGLTTDSKVKPSSIDIWFERYVDTTSDIYTESPSEKFSTFVHLQTTSRASSSITATCLVAARAIENLPDQ
jgi:hypothetical protein